MNAVRSILAAVDATDRARGVLSEALLLAERFDARVFLYRVVTPPLEIPPAAATPPDTANAQLQAEARRSLETLAAGHSRVVIAPPEVNALEPWRCIVQAAQRLGVELIVIGSHAYHGWDRVVGTTAAKVVNHADRNVLVVHQPSG